MKKKLTAVMAAVLLGANLAACGAQTQGTTAAGSTAPAETAAAESGAAQETAAAETSGAAVQDGSYTNSESGGHAIHADGGTQTYDGITVEKTGDSQGEDADFYGENAAILAENGATLTVTNADITTDGGHANAVFSYGDGTTVNISDSRIRTASNNSGGIMTTGGAVMNAKDLNVVTQGGSSAAIRSDRGGGTVTVDGGYYEANGSGSPAIYSTADITVNDAELVSTAAQGIVVEGKNSVTLNDTKVTADNVKKNSDKSDRYQAVMLYQSMSGDADQGQASFTMKGGSMESKNGGMFYVNNTTASIDLTDVAFTCATDDFLRIEKAGWGTEGANGGNVTFTASKQKIAGNVVVDQISTLNMYLKDGSSLEGAVNAGGSADASADPDTGDIYVELSGGSVWKLTADSYIQSLTCEKDSVDLNGHKLYVDGKEYEAGTASEGTAVEAIKKESAGMHGNPPEKPDGKGPQGGDPPQGNPPEKPDGKGPQGGNPPHGNPPEKPDGKGPQGSSRPQGNPPAKPGETTAAAETGAAQ